MICKFSSSKFIDPSKDKYPKNALDIFAKIAPAMLKAIMNCIISNHTIVYQKYSCYKYRSSASSHFENKVESTSHAHS